MTTTGAALRVAAIVVALLATTLLTHYVRGGKAIYFFEPHHIVWLFGASNTAFLAAMLLLLYRVARDGAAGVSLHGSTLNLAAVAVRGVFVGGGHFGSSAFALTEAALSLGAALALVLALHPATAARFALSAERPRAPRAPEDFPTATLAAGCVGWGVVASLLSTNVDHLFRWICLAVSIYLEAGAVLPQRALLLRTKRLPALTAHALFLWALSGALRLLLWVILLLEGELHLWLMLGDFVHVALLADFVALYVQSLAAGELAGEGMAMGELDV